MSWSMQPWALNSWTAWRLSWAAGVAASFASFSWAFARCLVREV